MSFSDSESNNIVNQRPLLRVWEGDFGIPSLDTESLRIWSYLKMNKIEFDIEFSTFPFFRPIPSLTVKGKVIRDVKSIWEKLYELKPSTDKLYDEVVQSRILAYVSYVTESLETATNMNLWVNESNYVNFTRMWYRAAVYFPFNRLHIKQIKDHVDNQVRLLANDIPIEDYCKMEYEKAQKCMSDLSSLLGSKLYFMGEYPTTLDVYVFGYFCLLLNAPFPDPTLQNILKGFPNLVQFVQAFCKNYFPEIKVESKYFKIKSVSENEEELPTKMVVAAGIFAVTAMFAYATMIGQFKIQK